MKKPLKNRTPKIKKKSSTNYSSWDPFTQAKYLYDLHQQLGQKKSFKDSYMLALRAVNAN